MLQALQIYLKAIAQSVFNAPLYKTVLQGTAKPWAGYGFAYALVLAGLLSLVNFIQVGVIVQKMAQDVLPKIVAQTPQISINKGEVSVKVPQPHKIMLDNKPVIVINTNADVAEAQKTTAPVFITKDTVYLTNPNGAREAKLIDKTITTKFGGTELADFMNKLVSWGLVLVWPLMWLGAWVVLLVQGACVALGSYIITAFMPEEFEFGSRIRIAVVALTPPLLVQLLIQLFGLVSPNFAQLHLNGLTVMGLALVYFYAMVRVVRAQTAQ